ncbi:unannotated protein [freshwater metagenome]|uniref:Unannotated protein n=1 Tax=freshwater metagenome TaxID=449393 RepID=A0A6J6FF18_9ZZZZ
MTFDGRVRPLMTWSNVSVGNPSSSNCGNAVCRSTMCTTTFWHSSHANGNYPSLPRGTCTTHCRRNTNCSLRSPPLVVAGRLTITTVICRPDLRAGCDPPPTWTEFLGDTPEPSPKAYESRANAHSSSNERHHIFRNSTCPKDRPSWVDCGSSSGRPSPACTRTRDQT